MRPSSPFNAISSVLSGLAQRFGMETRLLEQRLHRRWPTIVSEHIAAHTRPDQIRYRKLVVIVENSVWLHQLSFMKGTLVEKINADAGTAIISDVVLRVGEISCEPPVPNDMVVAEEPGPSPEAVAQAAALVAGISDPELRSLLTSARAAALSVPNPPLRPGDRSGP